MLIWMGLKKAIDTKSVGVITPAENSLLMLGQMVCINSFVNSVLLY